MTAPSAGSKGANTVSKGVVRRRYRRSDQNNRTWRKEMARRRERGEGQTVKRKVNLISDALMHRGEGALREGGGAASL